MPLQPIPDELKQALLEKGGAPDRIEQLKLNDETGLILTPDQQETYAAEQAKIAEENVKKYGGHLNEARTALEQFGIGALPSLATAAGSTALGARVAGAIKHPIISPLAGAATAVLSSIPISMASEYAEQQALKGIAPEVMHNVEMRQRINPWSSLVGRLGASIPAFGNPLKGIKSLREFSELKGVEPAVGRALTSAGTQAGFNLGTAAITGDWKNMKREDFQRLAVASLFGALQHGTGMTRAIANKYLQNRAEDYIATTAAEREADAAKAAEKEPIDLTDYGKEAEVRTEAETQQRAVDLDNTIAAAVAAQGRSEPYGPVPGGTLFHKALHDLTKSKLPMDEAAMRELHEVAETGDQQKIDQWARRRYDYFQQHAPGVLKSEGDIVRENIAAHKKVDDDLEAVNGRLTMLFDKKKKLLPTQWGQHEIIDQEIKNLNVHLNNLTEQKRHLVGLGNEQLEVARQAGPPPGIPTGPKKEGPPREVILPDESNVDVVIRNVNDESDRQLAESRAAARDIPLTRADIEAQMDVKRRAEVARQQAIVQQREQQALEAAKVAAAEQDRIAAMNETERRVYEEAKRQQEIAKVSLEAGRVPMLPKEVAEAGLAQFVKNRANIDVVALAKGIRDTGVPPSKLTTEQLLAIIEKTGGFKFSDIRGVEPRPYSEGENSGPFRRPSETGESAAPADEGEGVPFQSGLDLRALLPVAKKVLKDIVTGEIPIDPRGVRLSPLEIAFAQVKEHQLAGPENLIFDHNNPGIENASGYWIHMIEHGGDLSERLSMTRRDGGGAYAGRYNALDKAKQLLHMVDRPQGYKTIANEVIDSAKVGYKNDFAAGKFKGTEAEYIAQMKEAGERYAKAHEKIDTVTEPQTLGRDIAVAIGRMEWQKAGTKLQKLVSLLDSPNWEEAYWTPIRPVKGMVGKSVPPAGYTGPKELSMRIAPDMTPLVEKLTKSAKAVARENNLGWADVIDPLRVVHAMTKSTLTRLAQQGPLAAYVAANLQPLYWFRDFTANRKIAETKVFKGLLEDPRYVKWQNEQTQRRSWDFSTLPKELQAPARAFVDHMGSYPDEGNAIGQKIGHWINGKLVHKAWQKIAGYFPYAIDKEVWAEIRNGGPEAAVRKQQWIDNWKRWNGEESGADGERAWKDMISPISSARIMAGEPVFNQFRRAHGTPIPMEWRSKDLYTSLQNYNREFAVDHAWSKIVQSDPLMRRAFGIERDQGGNLTADADSIVRPDRDQWALIFREAQRHGAKWLSRRAPDMDLGQPMLASSNDAVNVLSTYSQRPINAHTTGLGKFANDINMLSGALMMETTTSLRDVAQAGTASLEYAVAGRGKKQVIDSLARSIMEPIMAVERAKKAGAMQEDVFMHQGAEVVHDAIYKTARAIRKYTGRNFGDMYGKALQYNLTHDTVLYQLTHGDGVSPLAREFGPLKGSPKEIAEATAAAVVQKGSPAYDARNLPYALGPQNNTFLGHMFRLSTWGVARFNNWMTDSYLPMVRQGSFKRFLSTIGFGVLGSAAASALKEVLTKKKPAGLTWQEWMHLSTEDQQRQFAPVLFGLLQSQGTMGIAGDLALPIVKRLHGQTAKLTDLQPSMPGIIVGAETLHTLYDFMSHVSGKGMVDKYDIVDLVHELAKTMQLYRDFSKPVVELAGDDEVQSADVAREKRIYEELHGVSAKTGKKLAPVPYASFGLTPKFSLTRSFNRRNLEGLRALRPALEESAEAGYVPKVMTDQMTDDFYQDVARRQGLQKGKAMFAAGQKENDMDKSRRDIALYLKSLLPVEQRYLSRP